MKYEIIKTTKTFNFQDFKDDLMEVENIFHEDIRETWEDKLENLINSKCALLCMVDHRIIGEAYTLDADFMRAEDDEDYDDFKHLNAICDMMEKENALYLSSLAVLHQYKGNGIASGFMQMIIADAKHKKHTAIYSHAHEGASTYLHEKFGGKALLKRENWFDTGDTYILYKIELN